MIRFAALFLLAIFAAPPAQADFGGCDAPAYTARFPAPPGTPVGPIICLTEFELPIDTSAGPRQIRGIRDAGGDWAALPGVFAAAEAGARGSSTVSPGLGRFETDDITILLLDGSYEPIGEEADKRGYVGALTRNLREGGECLVTVYLFDPVAEPRFIEGNTAHEIFHCIQLGSLSPAQIASTTGLGAWWAEGSAEYFASVATAEESDIYGRALAFAAGAKDRKPIYEMDYANAYFFWWFHEAYGFGKLMGFLENMGTRGDAAAQRAAMRTALTDADWLDFATAYAEASVRHPSGATLALEPFTQERFTFSETGSEALDLPPFTIRTGTITLGCGVWAPRLSPAPNLAAREEGSDWAPMPEEIDAGEAGATWEFAALHTGDAPQNVTLTMERTRACGPCAGSTEIDQCVPGVWEMTSGGPIAWMQSRGLPISGVQESPRVILLQDDGTYATLPVTSDFTFDDDEEPADIAVEIFTAQGRWSIAEGQLAFCQDSGGLSGTVQRSGTTRPVNAPGGGTLLQSYSCSATTLDTTLTMPGMEMPTTYTRRSPPPAPQE